MYLRQVADRAFRAGGYERAAIMYTRASLLCRHLGLRDTHQVLELKLQAVYTYLTDHNRLTLQSPLHSACLRNDIESICTLLAHERIFGHPINARDSKGFTILHRSCGSCSVETVRTLLDFGADVNAETPTRFLPIHMAAQWNNSRVCRLLVDCGADVDGICCNLTEQTPLDMAIENNATETCRVLVEAGATTLQHSVNAVRYILGHP